MLKAIGQIFNAIYAAASTAERVMVSVDNVAKVGQAHSAKLLKSTMEDLDITESDLELTGERGKEE